MRHLAAAILASSLLACAQSRPPEDPSSAGGGGAAPTAAGGDAAGEAGEPAAGDDEFKLREKEGVGRVEGSKIKPTATEAALRLFVIDKDTGPIKGIVVLLEDAEGNKLYSAETDEEGYTELLAPVGKAYKLSYLTLGKRDITANVTIEDKPRQNIKLTLRYKLHGQAGEDGGGGSPKFVLEGIKFATGKAKIKPESFPRLDIVVEFMTHKKSARIQISGHTDNVGKARANKTLSQKRADAVKAYIVDKGVDAGRVEAVGFGDEQPVAENDTEEGRAQNRRIEVTEI